MRRLPALLAALAVLAAAACGSDDAASGPASLAPAKSFLYAEVDLAPDGDQQEAVERLAGKFPGQGGPGAKLARLADMLLRKTETSLDFGRDVRPWLGDSAGFFSAGVGDDGAALIETDDEDAAEAALGKAARGGRTGRYEGREYRVLPTSVDAGAYLREDLPALIAGVVDGFVVVGTERAFKQAVDVAEGGEKLSDAAAYTEARDDAPDERLGFAYINGEELASSVPGLSGGIERVFREPYVATLTADRGGLNLTTSLPRDAASAFGPLVGRGSAILAEMPRDAALAFGQDDLGRTLASYVDAFAAAFGGRAAAAQIFRRFTGLDLQRDLLDWIGSVAIFARGDSLAELNGAVVIETTDPRASRRALGGLRRLVRRFFADASIEPLAVTGAREGFTVLARGLNEPIHVFQRARRFVVAYGDQGGAGALLRSGRLNESREFIDAGRALGGGFKLSLFGSAERIRALLRTHRGLAGLVRYLEPLGVVAGGARVRGENVESRTRITAP